MEIANFTIEDAYGIFLTEEILEHIVMKTN